MVSVQRRQLLPFTWQSPFFGALLSACGHSLPPLPRNPLRVGPWLSVPIRSWYSLVVQSIRCQNREIADFRAVCILDL
jgi:hypothetical protein